MSQMRRSARRTRRINSATVNAIVITALAITAASLSGVAILSAKTDFMEPEAKSSIGAGVMNPGRTTQPATNRDVSDKPGAKEDSNSTRNRLLESDIDRGILLRADNIQCNSGGIQFERSTDDGGSWHPVDTTQLDMHGIRDLGMTSSGIAEMSYFNSECETKLARSYSSGAEWIEVATASMLWTTPDFSASTDVVANGATLSAPCKVEDIHGLDQNGIILCQDTSIAITTDGGRRWVKSTLEDRVLGISAHSSGFAVLTNTPDRCTRINADIYLAPVDLNNPKRKCINLLATDEDFAISATPEMIYVWVGSEVQAQSITD